MELGAFSVSLTVKNLSVSKTFYENLGFQKIGGEMEQNWLILKNGNCVLGLFQGMFDKNILTFNPGWDQNGQNLESYDDVRDIQHKLKQAGVSFQTEADESTTGPAHCVVSDPDGNQIMFDQHV